MKQKLFLIMVIPIFLISVELNEGRTIWTEDQGFFTQYRQIWVRALDVDGNVVIWGKEVDLPSRDLIFDPFNHSLVATFNDFDATLQEHILADALFIKSSISTPWQEIGTIVLGNTVNSFSYHERSATQVVIVAATPTGVKYSPDGGEAWSSVSPPLNANAYDAIISPVNQTGTLFNMTYFATHPGGVSSKAGFPPTAQWQLLPAIIEEQDFEDVDTTIPGYLDSLPEDWIQSGVEDSMNYVRLDTLYPNSGDYSLLINSSGLGGSNVACEYKLPDVSDVMCRFQFRPLTNSGIIKIKNRLELKIAYSYGKMRYYSPNVGWREIYASGVSDNVYNEIQLILNFEDSTGIIITPSAHVTVELIQAQDDSARIVFSSEDYGYGSQPYFIDDVSVQPFIKALAPHRDSINFVYTATSEGIYLYDGVWSEILDVEDDWIRFETDLNGDYLVVSSPTQVFMSDDQGASWNDISGSIPNINDIYVDMNGVVYASTDSFPYRYDGSWTQLSNGFLEYGVMEQVKVCEAITMIEPDTIIVGNHNGMYFSVDGGNSWYEDNRGIEPYPIDSTTVVVVNAYFKDSVPSDSTMGLYELLTTKLGDIPDVDNDSLLHVVLLDIYEDGEDATSAYFDPTNEDSAEEYSNGMEIIYVDMDDEVGWREDPEDVKKKIIGSMAEMIHWNYDPDEIEWVKRGANIYAWYLTLYGDGNMVPSPITVDEGYIGLLDEYSLLTLYVHFYENYGGNDFIRDLIQSPFNGFNGLDSVLAMNGYLTDHDTVFLDWETSCVFDNFSLLDVIYNPESVSDSWDPEVFNEEMGYRNYVMMAESLILETDSLFFDADDYLKSYLKVIRHSSMGTISDLIPLNIYNEAYIPVDDSVVFIFPLITEKGDYLIDTKPWSFLPPRNLEVIGDYRPDIVELTWEEPEVGEKSAKHILNYDLYRSMNDTNFFTLLTSVDTTYYPDNSVYNESTYYYYVTGVYSNGVSEPSNMVIGHPTQFPPPTSFRAMGGDGVVSLYWSMPDSGKKELMKNLKGFSPPKGLIGFRLYRKLISDTYFTQIESLYVGTHYNDTLVMNDTTYIYGIRSLYESPDGMSPVIQCEATPYSGGPTTNVEFKPLTTGELWTTVTNRGQFGDPNADQTGNPSCSWPGSAGNCYLWEGRYWVGTEIGGTPYVSHADYGNYEFDPEGWWWSGPQKSDFDIVCSYNDWGPSNTARAIGLKIIQRALSWHSGPAANIIAYEFDIIWNKAMSDIAGAEDDLNLYCAWCFDADVSSIDPTDPHIDDLVSYDGWTNGEWNTLTHYPSPSDDYTILQDTTLLIPDGVPDQVCIYGDGSDENTILGDTQWIWRDMSYILDGDNPSEIGNDSTENGLSAGFIFASVLYAPESPNDSIWIDGMGDTCRLIRPMSHQWWNWNNDPGTDRNKYNYMIGEHSMSMGYKFLPHPYDVEADVFDYRFLLTYGPYSISDGDTLHLVLATGVGQGLNGGVDEGYGRGYLPGARQLSDYALMMYYDSAANSDPYHPSAPDEDIHWRYSGVEDDAILENKLSLNNNIILGRFLKMELQLKEKGIIEVEIFDKLGRKVKSIKESFISGVGTLIIPLESLPQGVYFLRGIINKEVICKEKVIIIN